MLLKLVILLFVGTVTTQNYGSLDGLGERISARVYSALAPLDGLGERINAQVQRNQVNLNNRLRELDHLGDSITHSVYQQLEPVRAIELNLKIKNGVGGVTIATHHPSGRRFIIKEHSVYSCSGDIDLRTGACSDSIPTPFQIISSNVNDTELCYIHSFSLVNRIVCLSTGSVSVSVIGNQVTCNSYNNAPVHTMSLDQYKHLCTNVRKWTEFIYIPDINNERHVQIPNENKYVKCENIKENVCTFKENNSLLDIVS